MKPELLLAYQLLAGCMDTATGLLLILAPVLTTHLMQLHVAADALPFLSYVGAFVLSVGIAYFYGAWLVTRTYFAQKLEVIWLLTAITRACVALFILGNLFTGALETGWATVAITDGALALFQVIGLSKGWLTNAA
jgi:hypothetical protein